MDFGVLGPVEVRRGDQLITISGRKERALLAVLLARCGVVVAADELEDELWPDGPPPSAPRTLQAYVARLRTALSAGGEPTTLLRRAGGGWVLEAERAWLDSVEFEDKARIASRALKDGSYRVCGQQAHDALALVRGRPYDGYTDLAACAAEAARLDAVRAVLEEDALEADLALGAATELVPRLESAVAQDPLRERRWALLMVALYRSGRQAAALEAYARAHRTLAEEIGVQPGPELMRVHRLVLDQTLPLHAPMPVVLGRRSTGCPFPGLAPFDAAQADAFVGRERLVARLLTCLDGAGVVTLVGPSGSGKSSVLAAGLIPVLAAGALPGSDRWTVEAITPTSRPVEAMRRVGPVDLLVVDQVEERQTRVPDQEERHEFARAVLLRAEGGARVVLGVRSDYWGDLVEVPDLGAVVAERSIPVLPLSEDEIRRVVVAGAQRGGSSADDDLVDRVVDDVRGQPGALPLLSTALAQTWEGREGDRLTVAGYEAAGGLSGAVAQLAEQTYGRLTPEQQGAARRILLRLVAVQDDGRPARRHAGWDEVSRPDDADARAAVDALVDARLVVATEDGVDVGHEALFTAWPRLARWIADDAAGRQLRSRITAAARAWDAAGRLTDDLVRGPLLVSAVDWAATHPHSLDRLETDFVDASAAHAEEERTAAVLRADRERRRNTQLRGLLMATAALLVIALGAASLATARGTQARREATTALATRLGAQALVEPRLDRALLLARQATATEVSPSTQGDLLTMLLRVPDLIRVADVGQRVMDVAVSPRGDIAVTTNTGDVLVLDPVSLLETGRLARGSGAPAAGLEYASGGDVLASAEARDGDAGYSVVLHDTRTGAVLASLPVDDAYHLHARADGRAVVTAADTAARSWYSDGRWTRTDLPDDVRAVSGYTRDGSAYATVSPTTGAVLRSTDTSEVLRRLPGATGVGVALSPDGRRLVVADPAGALHVWRTDDRVAVRDLVFHTAFVESLQFSEDGRWLLSAADDGVAVVWDVESGARVAVLRAASGPLHAAFAEDGREVVTGAADGTVARWSLTGEDSFVLTVPGPTGPGGAGLATRSSDGDRLLVAGDDGTLHVLDGSTLAESASVAVGTDILSLAASPVSGSVAVGTGTGASVVDLGTGAVRPIAGTPGSGGVAFSPDGRRIAVSDGRSGRITVVDVGTGAVVADLDAGGSAGGVAFSPDGSLLAVGAAGVEAEGAALWSTADWSLRRRLVNGTDTSVAPVVAFTDRGVLAIAARDGSVRFWDAEAGRPLSDRLPALPGLPVSISAAADGHVLAVGGWDGSVALLDARAMARIGSYPAADGSAAAVIVDRAGATLTAAWADGTLRRWPLRAPEWERRACSLVARALTKDEWRLFVGTPDYDPACR